MKNDMENLSFNTWMGFKENNGPKVQTKMGQKIKRIIIKKAKPFPLFTATLKIKITVPTSWFKLRF